MTAFIAGIIFGVMFMGCVFIVAFFKAKRPRREIEIWSEDAYQPPPVTTRILVNKREITL